MGNDSELNNQASNRDESPESPPPEQSAGEAVKKDRNNTTDKKDDRIIVTVEHLKPGVILKGKVYSEKGDFLFDEYHIFNEEEIKNLKEQQINKIYYTPMVADISEETRSRSLQFMDQFVKAIKSGKTANIDNAQKVVDVLINEVFSKEIGFINLIDLKDYDEYLYVHSVNVGILSIILAKKLGLKEHEVKALGLGAFIHDVGKINTPNNIVWKIESDDNYENKIISEHAMFGYKMLESSVGFSEEVLKIVLGHHENYDGSGYPAGISDKEIDKLVKIVSVCNYYDYLVEKSEGKEPLAPREAVLNIFEQTSKKFSPFTVKTFINDLSYLLLKTPIYPLGSIVLLNSKEIAVIDGVQNYSDINPLVRILSDSQGKKLPRPIQVNLKKDHTRHILKIVKMAEQKPSEIAADNTRDKVSENPSPETQ